MNIHAHGDQLLTVKNRDQIPCYGLRWAGDDLAQISLQLPDQRWLAILPKAATHPVLGQCDLVCGPFEHQGEAMAPEAVRTPITPFRAVDWTAPEAIPPLAEPGRLPAGGGAAILNLVAIVAARAGIGALRYTGPYPTEGLFDSLHTSFALGEADAADPVATCARFTEGVEESAMSTVDKTPAVDWHPRPFTWRWSEGGTCAQSRQAGVEAIYIEGRPYTLQGRSRRLIPTDGGFTAEVHLGGVCWAEIATFDPEGALVGGPHPLPATESPMVGQPLPEGFRQALVRALPPRAPALMAPALGALLEAIPLEWGDAGADEAIIRDGRLIVHAELASRLKGRPPGEALEALARIIEGPARRETQRQMAQLWARASAGAPWG